MDPIITSGAVCPLATCAKSGTCIRQLNYQKAVAEEPCFTILNTKLFSPTSDGCPYHLVKKTVRIAYGFNRLYGTVPARNTKLFRLGTEFGSDSTYYRFKRGEYGLSPSQQKRLLDYFLKNGADISVGFDRYQDEITYVKP